MTCDVYDQLFFEGMAQPHLGTFTLPFKEIIEKQQVDQDIMEEKINRII